MVTESIVGLKTNQMVTMIKHVYLAGPITGQQQSAATDWRQHVTKKVKRDIICLSPVRDNVDYSDVKSRRAENDQLEDLLHGIKIVTRDRMDIMRSDVVLVNVMNQNKLSIGTIGEIFWADAYRKPVIIVKHNDSLYNHAMLDALCHWKFDDLDKAINQINTLLSMYND